MSKQKKTSDIEAIEKLRSWGEKLEVDVDSEDFEDVVKALKMAVKHDKLNYNSEKRCFDLLLFSPINKENGEPIRMVEIRPTTMEKKRVIQGYKDSQAIDRATAMIAESCGIDVGFASRLEEKDVSRINAVIMGFLM